MRRLAPRALHRVAELQQPAAGLGGDQAQRIARVELQRGQQRQRQHRQGQHRRAWRPTAAGKRASPAASAQQRGERRPASGGSTPCVAVASTAASEARGQPAQPRRGAQLAPAVPGQCGERGQGEQAERIVRAVQHALPHPQPGRPEGGGQQREPEPGRAPCRCGCPSARSRGCGAGGAIAWRRSCISAAEAGGVRGRRWRRSSIASIDSATIAAPQVAGSGVPGTSAPMAMLLTPCGIGEGWFTLGGVLRRGVAHHLVHREEAGVLRQQVVAQAQLGDAAAQALAAFQRLLVGQRWRCGGAPTGSAARRCPGSRAWRSAPLLR